MQQEVNGHLFYYACFRASPSASDDAARTSQPARPKRLVSRSRVGAWSSTIRRRLRFSAIVVRSGTTPRCPVPGRTPGPAHTFLLMEKSLRNQAETQERL